MADEPLPLGAITSYHAHIYFDPGEGRVRTREEIARDEAERLRAGGTDGGTGR